MNPKHKKSWLKKRLAFFVIIFIIAILCVAFLLLPLILTRRHDEDRWLHARCRSNLKQIGLSLKQYAMDYKDFFPFEDNAQGLEKLRKLDYLTDYDIYVYPYLKTKKETKGILSEKNCGYVYLGGFKKGQNKKIPLAFGKPGNYPKRPNAFFMFFILFIDGSVVGYPPHKADSCEDIIIFLNKEHKYSDKLFKKLLSKAKKIDKQL
ncbi:MAG: hypothetical protein KOO69_07550 [Victivallales bacterium]|nr:hypothetical protein [Victivallales bacterium]